MEPEHRGAEARQHGGAGDGATLGERIDRVSSSAQHAWSRTRDAVSDIRGTLDIQGRVNRHPYATLAAAVGIGYVLGGGLFSRLTGRVLGLGLRLGIRLAAIPLLKEELYGLAEGLAGGEGQEGAAGRERSRHANTNKEREP
jgi:hypothetical protein